MVQGILASIGKGNKDELDQGSFQVVDQGLSQGRKKRSYQVSKKGLKPISLPPYSNTGVLRNEIGVRSDWINFCVREEKITRDIRSLAVMIFRRWARFGVFGGAKGWNLVGAEIDEFRPGFNGFENGCFLRFGEEIRGSIQWGGSSQNGWVQFELRGACLAILPRWVHLSIYRFACKYQVRINRCDLAADDYQGKVFCPRKAFRDWLKDPHRFLPPHRRGSGKGRRRREGAPETGETTYINKTPDTAIYLKIYDKGLERQGKGDIEGHKFPRWTRWETTFNRTKGAQIDYLVLHPDYWLPCMLGASQYFADIFQKKGLRAIWRIERVAEEPFKRTAKWVHTVNKQYGGGIYQLVRAFGLEGLYSLCSHYSSGSYMDGLTSYDLESVVEQVDELRFRDLARADSKDFRDRFTLVRAGAEAKPGPVAPGSLQDTLDW